MEKIKMTVTKQIKHFTPRARKNIKNKITIKIKHPHITFANHNSSKKPNAYKYTAAIFIIVAIIFAFLSYGKLSLDVIASIIGIISNLIGAILIASGVHLDKSTKRELEKSVRIKSLNQLTNTVINASNTIFMGILYMICGSTLQALALIP